MCSYSTLGARGLTQHVFGQVSRKSINVFNSLKRSSHRLSNTPKINPIALSFDSCMGVKQSLEEEVEKDEEEDDEEEDDEEEEEDEDDDEDEDTDAGVGAVLGLAFFPLFFFRADMARYSIVNESNHATRCFVVGLPLASSFAFGHRLFFSLK